MSRNSCASRLNSSGEGLRWSSCGFVDELLEETGEEELSSSSESKIGIDVVEDCWCFCVSMLGVD